MSIWAAIAGGFVGTLVLTSGLRAASELRLTRMDLPFLLGTIVTADRLRAKAIGYLLHFLAGLVFALMYYAVFTAIGRSGWVLGALFDWYMQCSRAQRSSTSSSRWCIHGWGLL